MSGFEKYLRNLPISLIKTFRQHHDRSRQVPRALLSQSIQVSIPSFLVPATMATGCWPAPKGDRISGKTETFNNSTCQYRSERNGWIPTKLLNRLLTKSVASSMWLHPVCRAFPGNARRHIVRVQENLHQWHLPIKLLAELGPLPSIFSLLTFPLKGKSIWMTYSMWLLIWLFSLPNLIYKHKGSIDKDILCLCGTHFLISNHLEISVSIDQTSPLSENKDLEAPGR